MDKRQWGGEGEERGMCSGDSPWFSTEEVGQDHWVFYSTKDLLTCHKSDSWGGGKWRDGSNT